MTGKPEMIGFALRTNSKALAMTRPIAGEGYEPILVVGEDSPHTVVITLQIPP